MQFNITSFFVYYIKFKSSFIIIAVFPLGLAITSVTKITKNVKVKNKTINLCMFKPLNLYKTYGAIVMPKIYKFINKLKNKINFFLALTIIFVTTLSYSSISYGMSDSFSEDLELAKIGNSGAAFRLGTRYLNGIEVGIDYSKALYFLSEAAKKDHSNAIYSLGYMYLYGEGVEVDQKKAFKLFRRSALLDFAPSYYMLGLMYYDGIGTKKSERKAYFNIKAAFEKGYESKNIFLDHDNKKIIVVK